MTKTVEFLYDFVSVPSYIAWTQIGGIAAQAGAQLVMTPVFCGGIFKALGNPGPLAVPAKRAWYQRDLERWVRKLGIAFFPSPHGLLRSLPLLRGVFVAEERGEADAYVRTVFEATFVHGRNMSDPAIAAAALREAGLDADAYLKGAERDDVKARLAQNTSRAVERGAFGVPTFFVGDDMFFGQDRLEFVREALQAR
jgi:2-hydroxychromene-2-carboxylate isomerase